MMVMGAIIEATLSEGGVGCRIEAKRFLQLMLVPILNAHEYSQVGALSLERKCFHLKEYLLGNREIRCISQIIPSLVALKLNVMLVQPSLYFFDLL